MKTWQPNVEAPTPTRALAIAAAFTVESLESRTLLAATFDYSMPPRFGQDTGTLRADGTVDTSRRDGRIDIHNNPQFVQQSAFTVNLTAAGSTLGEPITSYDWTIAQGAWNRALSGATVSTDLAEGLYDVTLKVKAASGASDTLTKQVNINDLLIVAMGDSIGSGEGAPDVPSRLFGGSFEWADSPNARVAHRSSYAGGARAALAIEQADPHTSVTFVFVASSGAAMERAYNLAGNALDPESGGMLDSQTALGTLLEPQIAQIDRIVGDRQIDRMLISAGANDARFGEIVTAALKIEPGIKPSLWGKPFASQQSNLDSLLNKIRPKLADLPRRYALEYRYPFGRERAGPGHLSQ
jgi:hypothetical protein